jgi:protocatechuate 3,4-dioxygenase beta subunit
MVRSLALCAAGFLFPSPSAAAPAERPVRPISVSGQVVGPDGAPLADAQVYLREWAYLRKKLQPRESTINDILATTTTDAEGRFAFRDVRPPKPSIFEAAGLRAFPLDVIATAKGRGLAWQRLAASNPSRPLTLVLEPEVRFRGRLRDPDGKPAAGVRVEVIALQPFDQTPSVPYETLGYLSLHSSQFKLTATSDREGQFVLGGLPGNVRVALVIADDRFARQTMYALTPAVPSPGPAAESVPTGGAAVPAKQGPASSADVAITLQPAHRLHVRVVFEDTKEPAAGALLAGLEGPTVWPDSPMADATGRFTLPQLAAGRYALLVAAPERTDYVGVSYPVTVPVDKENCEVTIALKPGIVVTGDVVDEETGTGIAGVTIGHKSPPSAPGETRWLASPTKTGPDGRFRMALPTGLGLIGIAEPVPGYVSADVASAGLRGKEGRLLHRVDPKPGQAITGLKLTLSRGLIAKFHVLDPAGKPVPGAEVSGFFSDAAGNVTLSGLDPEQGHELVFSHPERQLGARVLVAPSVDRKPVLRDVPLQPMGSATGRALDEDHKPVPRALVTLLKWSPFSTGKMTFFSTSPAEVVNADQAGRYCVHSLVPGIRYSVNLSFPGRAAVACQFDATTEPAERLPDLVLPKADQVLAGVVVDPRGQPLAGVRVAGSVAPPEGMPAGVRITSNWQVLTDKEGRFRLKALPKGVIRLTVYRSPGGDSSDRSAYSPTSVQVQAGKEDLKIVLAEPSKEASPEAVVGKPAPDFPVNHWIHGNGLPTSAGFTRKDFSGKVVVLAFLNEAKPSQRLLAGLNKLHEKKADKGLAVVRVYEAEAAPEDPAKPSPTPAALVAPGLLPGGHSEAFRKFGVRAAPTLFVMDREGLLKFADVEPDDLEARVDELLKN